MLAAPTPLEQPVVEPARPQTPGQGKHGLSQGRTGREKAAFVVLKPMAAEEQSGGGRSGSHGGRP